MRLRWFPVLLPAALMAAAGTPVTYHRDVVPVLQKRCQGCHRPGEAAPLSLLSYQEARPWAKAMREAVLTRKMPPWFADPRYGKFSNDRSLPQSEIDTLVRWADAGAPEGDRKHAPKPLEFADGWAIPKPDAVFEMPNEFAVPAAGTIEYQYIVIPTGFTEDKWVQIAEARPGNRAVVHHIIAFVREPGSKWLKDAKPGIPFVPERRRSREGNLEGGENRDDSAASVELLTGFATGMNPMILRPGLAKLIKAGSDLVFQMHYTANGKTHTDRSRVGLVFAQQPPAERLFTSNATNSKFVIPRRVRSRGQV